VEKEELEEEDEEDVANLKGVIKKGGKTERGEAETETAPETVGDLVKKKK
jgi:hypothetical protein